MSIEPLILEHQLVMRGLDTEVAKKLVALWRLAQQLDPAAARTLLIDAIPDITSVYGNIAAQVAADFYDTIRATAGLPATFAATPAEAAPADQVRSSVDWATSPMRTGEFNPSTVLSRLSGTTRRLVRQPGRNTILDSIRADPANPRYQRVSRPGACAWCLMMVSRGAVYKKDTVEFRAHDHCRCFGTPVFNDSQLTKESQELADEWAEVTQGTYGPDEAQKAWREHIKTKTGGAGGGGGGKKPPKLRSGTDGEGWSPDERKLVDHLRSLGHTVDRIPESGAHGVKTADALVDQIRTEFKTLDSNETRALRGEPPATVKSLISSAKRSKGQASSAIIDVRNTPISREEAEEALRRLKGSPQIRSDQIRFIGRDFDITGNVS